MRPATILILAATLVAGGALAKLPDATPEAKAKAELTKAETAHKGKIEAYQLCQSQDKAAKKYLSSAEGKGKKAASLPPCADPGKFVPPPPAAMVATAPAAAPAAPAAAKK
ncbi:MAG: formate dehydrogenase [Sulfuritalea sp.]|nr:formate dehydrogenase [Sulfuritalea sp.]